VLKSVARSTAYRGTAPRGEWNDGAGTHNALPPPPARAPESAALDLDALQGLLSLLVRRVANLAQLIDSFLEEAPHLLAELNQAVTGRDARRGTPHGAQPQIERRRLGAATFAALCRELEMMGKDGRLDGAADLAARLSVEYVKVAAALQAVRREGCVGQAQETVA